MLRCAHCAQFVDFANKASGTNLNVDDFWSNALVKCYYTNHMSFLMNHPNKLANNLQFKVGALLRCLARCDQMHRLHSELHFEPHLFCRRCTYCSPPMCLELSYTESLRRMAPCARLQPIVYTA